MGEVTTELRSDKLHSVSRAVFSQGALVLPFPESGAYLIIPAGLRSERP